MVCHAQNKGSAPEVTEATPLSDATLRGLFAQNCDFVLAAGEPEHFASVPGALPEVAFWGRSNVGKSSLINAVTGRKGLARASNTPGRTQQIVFFNLGDALMLADMPGYGFAQAPKADIKKWNALIAHYLQTRSRLRCVLLLIDGRHGIMKADEDSMRVLDSLAINYQVILTKADKARGKKMTDMVAAVEGKLKKHPAARPFVIATSAEHNEGIDAVRRFLMDFIPQN